MATLETAASATGLRGLTEAEALARRARGQGNNIRVETSRSYGDILRQNFLNPINLVLFFIGAVMILIGRVSDAVVSVGLILLNVVIGVYQEIRAKRQLDRIALLTRPRVTLIRDGKAREADPSEIVLGDLIVVRTGDQVVVDGPLLEGSLEVDESQLTGESDLVRKQAGDDVFSASFCITGQGVMEAARVGAESFASQLVANARSFRVVRTPLQRDIDLVIRLLILIAVFIGFLLLASAIIYDVPLMRGVQMAAVIAGIIPNGLFFMVIVAYAMGAVRIARLGALVQQANSVESLSNVDVLCMDKTGTLTANRIQFEAIHPIGIDEPTLRRLLGDFASSAAATNRTGEALAEALGGQRREPVDEVPFSSQRKWSALAFDEEAMRGVFVMGAPEMIAPHLANAEAIREPVEAWSARGLRVLLFAQRADTLRLYDDDGKPALPDGLNALGVIAFRDELRPDVERTLARFVEAGIRLKVISGDNPHTVAALARQAGMTGDLRIVSGLELAEMDEAEFARAVDEGTIFGRITPQQKERIVEALRAQGHYVAMVGDGVNDVLSLKKAQLGIAMQSGSNATRSVADMVLLGDSFAALPPAFTEGQRIINGMQDILRLFLARTLSVTLLILATMVIDIGFPFVPKHNSLSALLTVGIPTLALAVWARPRQPEGGLLRSIMHFVFPAAITVFVFGLLLYAAVFTLMYSDVLVAPVTPEEIANFQVYAGIDYELPTQASFAQEVASLTAQSALTVFVVLAGLLLIVFVEPPIPFFVAGDRLSPDRRPTILALALLGVFIVVLAHEPFRHFFELVNLSLPGYLAIAAWTGLWALVLRRAWRGRWLQRFLQIDPRGGGIR